jgi:hypothetical protein
MIPIMHQSSNIATNQLKNLIYQFKQIPSPTIDDKRFFGKWAKDLILTGTVNTYIVENGINLLEDEIANGTISIDHDDFSIHSGLIFISMKSYTDALCCFEQVSTTTKLHIELHKWKTITAILQKSMTNYSNNLSYNASTCMNRDPSNLWCGFNDEQKDKFALLLVKLHAAVRYWNKLSTNAAYLECALALNQTCMFFESLVKSYCLSKNSAANVKDLNSMISGEVNYNNAGVNGAYIAAVAVANPKTSYDYNLNYTTLISHVMGQATEADYIESLFHLARVTRNNAAHGLDFNNKIFYNSQEFRTIIDIMIEAILATKKLT